jgi:ammonia channel protein AmtB
MHLRLQLLTVTVLHLSVSFCSDLHADTGSRDRPVVPLWVSELSLLHLRRVLFLTSCQLFLAILQQNTVCRFSLSYSEKSNNGFIGNFHYGAHENIFDDPISMSLGVPAVAFSFYQLMFACITPALIFGACAERVRILPAMIFVFLWTTFVYDFAAYWTWSLRGW